MAKINKKQVPTMYVAEVDSEVQATALLELGEDRLLYGDHFQEGTKHKVLFMNRDHSEMVSFFKDAGVSTASMVLMTDRLNTNRQWPPEPQVVKM